MKDAARAPAASPAQYLHFMALPHHLGHESARKLHRLINTFATQATATKNRVGTTTCGTIVCSRIPIPQGQRALDSPTRNNEEIVDNRSITLSRQIMGWVGSGTEVKSIAALKPRH